MQKPFTIGILGCGTIGSEVALQLLSGKLAELKLKKILIKNIGKERLIPNEYLTDNPNEVLEDPEIDLIIELMGVEKPALEYILKSLENKKHLVTANKELVAKHGPQIFEVAKQNKMQVRLDATVGGGIPIINTLLDSLKANRISSVVGILNGTTNYILSKMKKGQDFAEALQKAQEKGYAEPDPTNDIDGIDAKYKISILASLAFRTYIAPEDVKCMGIRKISASDFLFAKELDFSIKLLGIARRHENNTISVNVHPCLIPLSQPLAQIDGVLNAIQVRGNLIQELLLVGPGAGPKPTSSALLGDALAVMRHEVLYNSMPYEIKPLPLCEYQESRFYLHLIVKDQIGVIRDLGNILAQNEISLESITQKAHQEDLCSEEAALIMLTHKVKEIDFQKALEQITEMAQVKEICCFLKVFE